MNVRGGESRIQKHRQRIAATCCKGRDNRPDEAITRGRIESTCLIFDRTTWALIAINSRSSYKCTNKYNLLNARYDVHLVGKGCFRKRNITHIRYGIHQLTCKSQSGTAHDISICGAHCIQALLQGFWAIFIYWLVARPVQWTKWTPIKSKADKLQIWFCFPCSQFVTVINTLNTLFALPPLLPLHISRSMLAILLSLSRRQRGL